MSFANPEFLRELIRRDQEQQAAARLRDLITEGLECVAGRPVTDDVIAELRELQTWESEGRSGP